MEAKELRIGNWIYSNTDKDIYRVDLIESWRNYLSISAILLTEEWLLRFGFEYINETIGYANERHYISQTRSGLDWLFMPFCTNDEDCYIKISYVHQLQNLYFALTGKELV